MSKTAAIIDDCFEKSEYTEPVKSFQEKGHDIVHAGIEKGNP
jgi:protease I